MIRLFFICSFLLFSKIAFSEVIWTGEFQEGKKAVLELSSKQAQLNEEVQIILTVNVPESYRLDVLEMRKNLLSHIGYGPQPFSFVSQEVIVEKQLQIERVIFTLKPNLLGKHFFSLGKVTLYSDRLENSVLSFVPDIFEVIVNEGVSHMAFEAGVASPLPFSVKLPVTIDSQNQQSLSKQRLYLEKMRKHPQFFEYQGDAFFAFISLLIIKLFMAGAVLYRIMEKAKVTVPKQVVAAILQKKALKKIEQLQKERPDGLYYSHIVDIFREFVEKVFEVNALASTTREFLQTIDNIPELSDVEKKNLFIFFEKADRIKFGKRAASLQECQKIYAFAKQIIVSLRPR